MPIIVVTDNCMTVLISSVHSEPRWRIILFFRNWVEGHVNDVKNYLPGKPVLLSEFGRSELPVYPTQAFGWMPRERFYNEVFNLIESIMRGGDSPLQVRKGKPNYNHSMSARNEVAHAHKTVYVFTMQITWIWSYIRYEHLMRDIITGTKDHHG